MKTLLLSLLTAASASAALVEKTVEYDQGGTTLEGFHVYNDAFPGKRPGVLIIHQWTGLTDYEKMRARLLAEMGFNVFAADIYGKGIRPQPPEAGKEAGKYKDDRDLYRARLDAGLEVLKKDEHTDATKIAAIGYCFGGTGVLELARSGADLAGVVSFHGGLGAGDGKAAAKGGVKAKVLVCHGADDPFVPADELSGFQQEMRDAGADWQFIAYSGAVHAFTQKMAGDDNSKGAAYNEKADRRSWEHMKLFFAELFGG
ncbi:dienelactone hydrolase family protein [Luteolibacter marinus]|uniref:dienelactone hydrolase family protein n=1 Tax=Luteolibacter marinus TaxID=2776705 RepID=UPI001868E960|nr:dienelactone hydrolase family protein [Luteolibacter marinus]